MQKAERTLAFSSDSPCLEGHFPGNPVVPAVAILAELIGWTEERLGRRVTGVTNARFRKPLLPDTTWQVVLEARTAEEATLIAQDGEGMTMRARLATDSC